MSNNSSSPRHAVPSSATEWPVLAEAHQILHAAVAGVPAAGWAGASPCADWSVAQVAQHAAMDQLLYASSVGGIAKPEGDAFQPSGEWAGDPVSTVEDAIAACAAAFAEVAADAEGIAVPLPPFAVPATIAEGAAALDAAVHGWDIAVATGQPNPLTDPLARTLLSVASQLVEPLRGWGAYAPAIEPAADADDTTRLLNYLGRRPEWQA